MIKKVALKSKFGSGFGFKGIPTPAKKSGEKKISGGGFDPARFKTQHKG